MKDSTMASVQSYPTYELSRGIQIGEAVHKHGGERTGVSKSQIAAALKLSESSSSFALSLATARSFGIITGRGDYTLTEAGRKYFVPHSESDRKTAAFAFLTCPPAFAKFIELYDGTKIDPDYLPNLFASQCGVGKSWSNRVASIFLKAAETVGAMDGAGFLRYHANLKSLGSSLPIASQTTPGQELSIPSTMSPSAQSEPSQIRGDKNVWVYTVAGKTVKLETPQEIPTSLWQKLKQYVEIIQPVEEQK